MTPHKPTHPSQFSARLLSVLVLLSLLASACGSLQLPGFGTTAQPAQEESEPVQATAIPETEVTFRVELPPNSPAGAQVYVTLLDEVTGLALNAQTFAMEAEQTGDGAPAAYSLSLPLAMGSLVKYRYERQIDGARVAEHVSNGAAVRYRLYHVEGPGEVRDVISRWTDTPYDQPSGRIMGQATDAETGQPLANLLVAAGGAQAFTAADGSFLLEGLPPGVHNLVAMALDGKYRTFQQGARVADQSTTPAPLKLSAAPITDVMFIVRVPESTPPAVPVRLAGSLYQLGNTFSDLAGGVNTLPARMPVLNALPDGRYTITMGLPEGADLRYKFTLGDGFWNAEHMPTGEFRLRQLIVPEGHVVVEDTIDTWASGGKAPITFDLTVPENTPAEDVVSVQFNPIFGWMEPVPMWRLGGMRWAYILFSPLDLPGELRYRYCRNGQCGVADDSATAGAASPGRSVTPAAEPVSQKDTIEAWDRWQPAVPVSIETPDVPVRGPGFTAGVAMMPGFAPSWRERLPAALDDIAGMGANRVVFSPSWSFTRNNFPVLELAPGRDALWPDMVYAAEQAKARNLPSSLYPTVQFPTTADDWWQESALDFPWWQVFYERYRTYLLYHAGLSARAGASALILGGDWLWPALPNGTLPDGSASGVPLDAEQRWRSFIAEVRSQFGGTVLWAMPYARIQNPPPFLDAVDGIYLEWESELLSYDTTATGVILEDEAERLLDTFVLPVQQRFSKPVILAVSYPSADGGIAGCLPDGEDGCLELGALSPLLPDQPGVTLDLQEQADAYAALLVAASNRTWITGFVSAGYYPPARLEDKSISVHGKPASAVLSAWYPLLTGAPVP